MVVFSSLRNCYCKVNQGVISLFQKNLKNRNNVSLRLKSDHRIFPLLPTKFQYNKFKNMLHFYVMIGLIPIGLIVAYVNVFIGPATLAEIPKDYTPYYWEYRRHPITRFIARYIQTNLQQEYEKYMHLLYESDERAKIRLLESKIKALMKERGDYEAYYYIPYTNTNFLRVAREKGIQFKEIYGDV